MSQLHDTRYVDTSTSTYVPGIRRQKLGRVQKGSVNAIPNSCRCSVGGETIRLSSRSSSSIPVLGTSFFFFHFFFCPFFFLHGRWYPLYVPFFFATHHPPVITTCSWGSVGPLPCTSQSLRWPSSFTHVCTRKKGTTALLLYTAVLRVLEKKGTTAVLLYTAVLL